MECLLQKGDSKWNRVVRNLYSFCSPLYGREEEKKEKKEKEKREMEKENEMENEKEGKNLACARELYTPSSTEYCCLFEWNVFSLKRSLFSLREDYFPGHCVIPNLHCFDPKQKRKTLVKGFRVTSS